MGVYIIFSIVRSYHIFDITRDLISTLITTRNIYLIALERK
nr:MAG TPA: hypothetical protein [Caudoviricetes sp.]